jgi:hypothetical protein
MRIRIVVSADPATWGRGRDTQAAAARLAALCKQIARRDYPHAQGTVTGDNDAARAAQLCGVEFDSGETPPVHWKWIVEDIITEAYEQYEAGEQPCASERPPRDALTDAWGPVATGGEVGRQGR